MVLFAFLLTTSLFACVQPWVLLSSHSGVTPKFTQNVSFTCFDDGSHRGAFKFITRIRILKFDATNTWRTFALKFAGYPPVGPPGSAGVVSVTGNVGKPEESFLSVNWPEALNETAGRYRCEVNAFDIDDTLVTLDDIFANITIAPFTLYDVIGIVVNMKRRIEEMDQKRLNETRKVLEESLAVVNSRHETDNATLTNEIRAVKKTVSQGLESNIQRSIKENWYEARIWPKGPMAIPASTSGCPMDTTGEWPMTTVTINRTLGLFYPNATDKNHLYDHRSSTPTAISLSLCLKLSRNGGISWPKGSYCILIGSTSCPDGFNENALTLKSTSSEPSYKFKMKKSSGIYIYSYADKLIRFYFCCRNDGPATTSIVLPTHQPFYLYRNGGKCQTVFNADVTNEAMTLATSHTFLDVSWRNKTRGPDSAGSRLELCYYQRHGVQSNSSN